MVPWAGPAPPLSAILILFGNPRMFADAPALAIKPQLNTGMTAIGHAIDEDEGPPIPGTHACENSTTDRPN